VLSCLLSSLLTAQSRTLRPVYPLPGLLAQSELDSASSSWGCWVSELPTSINHLPQGDLVVVRLNLHQPTPCHLRPKRESQSAVSHRLVAATAYLLCECDSSSAQSSLSSSSPGTESLRCRTAHATSNMSRARPRVLLLRPASLSTTFTTNTCH